MKKDDVLVAMWLYDYSKRDDTIETVLCFTKKDHKLFQLLEKGEILSYDKRISSSNGIRKTFVFFTLIFQMYRVKEC